MGIKSFFEAAKAEAGTLLLSVAVQNGAAPGHVILDRALTRAMVDPRRRRARLRRGQGAQARARLLVAASRLGLCDAGMLSGESVEDWLRRGLHDVAPTQLLPLLRAAARERAVRLADLDARAP